MTLTIRGCNKVVPIEDAVALVKDDDTVFVSGIGYVLTPRALTTALEARFLATEHPRNLLLYTQTMAGSAAGQFGLSGAGYGQDQFAHEGMVRSFVSSNMYPDWFPMLTSMVYANEISCYMFPMGVTCHMLREAAGDRPGFLSKVGLWSYVDPRVAGPGQNPVSTDEYVKVMEVDGEEYLFYRALPVDVALLRGTTADEEGNISLEHEPLKLAARYAALAAKARGGKVIVQVKHIAKAGTIDPRLVDIPSILVDAVVHVPDQWQLEDIAEYHPGLAGTLRQQVDIPEVPFTHEKVVARRAAMELNVGDTLNCGFRIPQQLIPKLALEEGFADLVNFSMEHGVLGGDNVGGILHWNPTSWLSSLEIFDYYDGGGLNIAQLALGELDEHGSVNLTRLGDYLSGPGGAIDIGHAAPKVVFSGTFMQGGLQTQVGNGRISIVQEGRKPRFRRQVDQITFSDRERVRKGQQFRVITERGVFDRLDGQWVLIEVAPGIDVQTDILDRAEFPIRVADDLRLMDERLFRDEPMGLREIILDNGRAASAAPGAAAVASAGSGG